MVHQPVAESVQVDTEFRENRGTDFLSQDIEGVTQQREAVAETSGVALGLVGIEAGLAQHALMLALEFCLPVLHLGLRQELLPGGTGQHLRHLAGVVHVHRAAGTGAVGQAF